VFDLGAFDAFLERVAHLRVPIVAGLWPFDSQLNAEFLANEVPGVRVPDELLRRMRQTETPEAAAAEGVAIAREVAAAIRDRVQGFQLSNATGRIQAALRVLDAR
jgi:homocysteine S-methyltransferase